MRCRRGEGEARITYRQDLACLVWPMSPRIVGAPGK